MRRLFLSFFVAVTTCATIDPSVSQTVSRKLEKTYTGEITEHPMVGRSPTFGYAAETFVANCELFLFGRYVPPEQYSELGDDAGYLIKKTKTEVTVNGRVFVATDDPPAYPQVPIPPRIKERAAVRQRAADEIRSRKQHRDGVIVLDGVERRQNEPFPFTLEDGTVTVMVTFLIDGIQIEYDGHGTVFVLETPPPVTKERLEEQAEQRLDVVYNGLVKRLKPGRIVLAGLGYSHSYPLWGGVRLKSALHQIPSLAEQESIVLGEVVYKSIRIDGFLFTSEVISDFAGDKPEGHR